MSVLKVDEIYKFFHSLNEQVVALRGVSLEVFPGEMVALVGPSGSGKSTLLSCVTGIEEPDAGTCKISSHVMTRIPEIEKSRLRATYVGIMLQHGNLFGHLSVKSNVMLAQKLSQSTTSLEVTKLLDDVGLKGRHNSFPNQLSGGEKARASLAVAMSSNPAILVLDEPTGEVDLQTEMQLLNIFKGFCIAGGAILVASHNPALMAAATRTIVLRDGRVSDV